MKTYIWGTGYDAKNFINKYPKCLDDIEAFVAENTTDTFFGKKVISHEDFYSLNGEYQLVIATSKYFTTIFRQCVSHDIPTEKIRSLNEYYLDLIIRGIILPKKVWLDICNLCQLNCTECYMRTCKDRVKVGSGYCSAENFERFIDNNREIESIEISNNGEPFLNPDIDEILKIAFKHRVRLTASNGVNFNDVKESTLELLVATQLRHITVSLDGTSQESYSVYRQNGNYEKVISNVERINYYKKKYRSKYPELTWKFILMDHNQDEVEKVIELARKLEMKTSFVMTWGHFTPKEPEKIKRLTGLNFITRDEYKNGTGEKAYSVTKCIQPYTNPTINWDGRLLGCCHDWFSDFKVNVFEKGLKGALSSEEYVKTKKALIGQEEILDKNNPCIQCAFYRDRCSEGKYLDPMAVVEDAKAKQM